MLHPGLYEQVINHALKGELSEVPEARKAIAPIDQAEASKVLAQYLADVVQKALDNVLLVTLNKSDKDYSPTTMYNDYSISGSLFHWQSQSTTAEQSPTGQRCIHHLEAGSSNPGEVPEKDQ